MINLDDFTELEDGSIFKIESQPLMSYEKDYDVQMDISFEMNLDQKVIARAGYTSLDYISDIGGMQGMLLSLMAWLIAIWNYNMFNDHLVTRLYKIEKVDADKQIFRNYFDRSEFMFPKKFSNPRDYIRDMFSCIKCGCCRPDRLDKGFALGRQQLQKETNIIEIIKSRRYFNHALRLLLTK